MLDSGEVISVDSDAPDKGVSNAIIYSLRSIATS